MAATQDEGQGVISKDGVVTFFNVRGKLEDGRRLISTTATGELEPLGHTESVIGFVLAALYEVYRSGNTDKVVFLEIDPYGAMVLYLEGQLCLEQLQRAVKTADRIDIPAVVYGGHALTLRILQQTGRRVAVTDAKGDRLHSANRACYH